jgi:hypothetical protein
MRFNAATMTAEKILSQDRHPELYLRGTFSSRLDENKRPVRKKRRRWEKYIEVFSGTNDRPTSASIERATRRTRNFKGCGKSDIISSLSTRRFS